MNRLEHYKTINPSAAKELQQELRQQIKLEPLPEPPKYIAGADISFSRGSDLMHAAIIVLELPDLTPVARSLASDETSFPYIPGLLAFREMPVLLKAWNQLKLKSDVLILDGHGVAHPRRMGIATHFGIEVDHPTIGCAKNILTGTHGDLGIDKGDKAYLIDDDEKIGIALRSRTNVNPIYVSPGYRCSFKDTYNIVMGALTKYKLPKTSRLAHQWANKLRRGEAQEGYVEF
ncbi:deoxyribonuclease V [Aliifodinibius salipaludis]|uniref:Endonuclease V n=1 Tax=Fodinibius salipaludis TaxID=2032627 RepID=A0A2A2G711_9BACT|nr:deoxyribonuclease V [Aliifodinibius salipaludis]PAU92920.1 deoxyribonuclease V [Aliifodinibius salipaludis]